MAAAAGKGSPNPFNNPALVSAAKALVQAQVGQPISELVHQIAINNRQGQGAQQQTAGYFGQLGGQAQQGYRDVTQTANDLNARLGQIGQGNASSLRDIAAQGMAQQAKYSPGLSGGPGAQALAAEMSRQQGLGAQNMGAFQSFGANQGAIGRTLAGQNLGTFALSGQETLGRIGQAAQLANEPLNAKVAGLRQSEGALLSKAEGQLRQQDVTNAIAEKLANVHQQEINSLSQFRQGELKNAAKKIQVMVNGQKLTYTQNKAKNRLAFLNYQLSKGKLSESTRHDYALERTALIRARNSGKGGSRATGGLPKTTPTGDPTLSPLEQSNHFQTVDRLQNTIRAMRQPLNAAQAKALGMAVGTQLSDARIRGLLGQKYDPGIVDAAYMLVKSGGLGPSQIQELNRLGLIVGGRYRRIPAPTPGGAAKRGVNNAVGGVKGILGL